MDPAIEWLENEADRRDAEMGQSYMDIVSRVLAYNSNSFATMKDDHISKCSCLHPDGVWTGGRDSFHWNPKASQDKEITSWAGSS